MAARKCTDAQRAAQSAAIHTWQPWQHSTGAKSAAGKVIVSRNAYRGGTRPLCRFIRWFYRAIEHQETLTREIVEEAKLRCFELVDGDRRYLSTVKAKQMAKFPILLKLTMETKVNAG